MCMDNELMALMQVLSNKPYLTLKDIEVSAGITRRQATYRIAAASCAHHYHWNSEGNSIGFQSTAEA